MRGRDLETRTTSAVGKTSLLSAIAYALGFGPPTSHTASWGAEDSEVALEVELGGEVAKVTRGTGQLTLKIGDTKWRGKAAEQELRDRLGDLELLRALTWRKQRAKGNFFALRPTPRREFLATLLGLDTFEQKAEEARKAADQFRAQLPGKSARLERAEADLRRVEQQELPEPSSPDLSVIDLLRTEEERLRRELGSMQPPTLPEELGQLQQMARSGSATVARLTAQHQEALRRLSAERVRAAGRCPECGQSVPATSAVEAWSTRAAELAAQLEQEREQLSLAEQALPILENEYREALAAWSNATADLRAQLEAVQSALHVCAQEGRDYRAAVSARQSWQAARERCETELGAARADLEQAKLQEAAHRDLAHLLRQYVVGVFEEVLVDLSATTNTILGQVPNVSDCSVDFCSEERGVKREVSEKVYVGGVERDRDDLSGGQEAAFELAVDLALFDVVSGRGAVQPTWMVLDEPFDGMGAPDKEAFLDIMQARRDRLYLVIDHSREFGELFIRFGIGVEKSAGRSRIVTEEERKEW